MTTEQKAKIQALAVQLKAVDPDKLRRMLDGLLSIGAVITRLTPPDWDDAAIVGLRMLVDEPGLLEALLEALGV